METYDKLKKLLSLCKCGVFISVNEHRDYYMTVKDKLKELDEFDEKGFDDDISEEKRKTMIENDTIIDIQIYPKTPVGFCKIYGHDIDDCLDEAINCAENY